MYDGNYVAHVTHFIFYSPPACSTFIDNGDGGGGGVLSTAYLPLRFSGHSVFMKNRGRTLVVGGNTCMYTTACVQYLGSGCVISPAMFAAQFTLATLMPGVH